MRTRISARLRAAEQDAADQVGEAVLFVAGQFAFGVVVPARQGDDGDVGDGEDVVGHVQQIPVGDADVAADGDQALQCRSDGHAPADEHVVDRDALAATHFAVLTEGGQLGIGERALLADGRQDSGDAGDCGRQQLVAVEIAVGRDLGLHALQELRGRGTRRGRAAGRSGRVSRPAKSGRWILTWHRQRSASWN